MKSNSDLAKKAAGEKAAELIKTGMTIGLGTGSTASHFIACLIEKVRSGLHIQAVATSERSYDQAKKGGIPLIDINTITSLDLTVDGADEIDSQKRMIKGGGGALLREKIVASMSRELVVVIDSAKQVEALGRFPLPVEIVPFATKATLSHLADMGYQGSLRRKKDGELYITDGGHNIYDIQLSYPCKTPEQDHQRIRNVPGVVDTGFFFNLAGRVIVGHEDGSVEIRQ